ncbi:MAG: hypothetical protein AAF483_15490 [Planctomycetota bacterium]
MRAYPRHALSSIFQCRVENQRDFKTSTDAEAVWLIVGKPNSCERGTIGTTAPVSSVGQQAWFYAELERQNDQVASS